MHFIPRRGFASGAFAIAIRAAASADYLTRSHGETETDEARRGSRDLDREKKLWSHRSIKQLLRLSLIAEPPSNIKVNFFADLTLTRDRLRKLQ